ncbi:MAG: hypothetical protein SF029_18760 [bacterium]|jgi:hypothetical protein|nr:hypothetical protein [bacterium]
MSLDDLRREADEEEASLFDDDDGFGGEAVRSDDALFLGMTPIERMFISIFLFMNVAVLGLALLLATGRIG